MLNRLEVYIESHMAIHYDDNFVLARVDIFRVFPNLDFRDITDIYCFFFNSQ